MGKKLTGNRLGNLIIIVAIILIPLMYAGLLTWAYEAPLTRISRLKAAVVNLDRPTTEFVNNQEKTFNLGQELMDKILAKDAPGFGWEEADLATAKAGLADGRYRAMLVIPNNFSRQLAKLSNPENPVPTPPVLRLETDDSVNYLAGSMATSVAKGLEGIVQKKGASNYIDQVLVSLSPLKDGLREGADGANKLADGTNKLAGATEKANSGAKSLNSGVDQLLGGAHRLSGGTHQLAQGSQSLVVGLRDLANGTVLLQNNTVKLADGVNALAIGSKELQAGIDKYTQGVSQANSGAKQFAAQLSPGNDPQNPTLKDGALALEKGLKQLVEGSDKLKTGFSKAQAGIKELQTGVHKAGSGAQQLKNGADELAAGTPKLEAGAKELAKQLQPGTDSSHPTLKDGTAKLSEFVSKLAEGCSKFSAILDPVCIKLKLELIPQGGLKGLAEKAKQLDAGMAQAGAGANQLAEGATRVHAGAQRLDGGLAQLHEGLVGSNPTTPSLAVGLDKLAAAMNPGTDPNQPTLADGAYRLNLGLNQAYLGTQRLNQGFDIAKSKYALLTAGLTELDQNSLALRQGSQKLADGNGLLASKVPALNNGVNRLTQGAQAASDGANRLGNGAKQLDSGAQQLNSGLGRAKTGTQALSDGLGQIHEGMLQANDGADKLATGLEAGADKLPNISKTKAKDIAEVAGGPAVVKQIRNHPVYDNGIGFSPFFIGLGLWIGGIALFLIFPALDNRRQFGEPFFVCMLRSLGTTLIFGLAQAATVILGLEYLLYLHAVHLGTLILICMLTSIAFVSINQACVAALGFRGRFVSVLLLCLQLTTAGATFPIETTDSFLQFLHPLLPMTYVVASVRSLIAGGTLPLIGTISVLVGWMLASWLITAYSAYRRRGQKPMPFDPALAFPGSSTEKAGA